MSSSRNTTSRNTSAVATPFCKVCRDAGKPEKEYTSHFVKDQPGPDGKVVCPTLLNQACRICHKTGHTSSYCPEYNARRRGERYIEREFVRDHRDQDRDREDYRRGGERYIEREFVREHEHERREHEDREYRRVTGESYIEREFARQHTQREDREDRRYGYKTLREDTERQEREVRQRDEDYYREQDRRSKPWLQAAMKQPVQEEQRRRQPYAHPHGPKVRLNIESPALCVSKHAETKTEKTVQPEEKKPAIDIRKVDLKHASNWGDEDNEAPFVCDPEEMYREFARQHLMKSFTSDREVEFIEECDDQSQMPFCCKY